jgi:trehalose 6-phosphate phosphatase
MPRRIGDLPNALARRDEIARWLSGRLPAVFLDYDGTLTPIVRRPADAVISPGMQAAVQRLARRCPVCLVTGRDRAELDRLMDVDDLVVAANHGFDISGRAPDGTPLDRTPVPIPTALLDQVATWMRRETAAIEGAAVEPKRASVAVHYRQVPDEDRPRVARLVAEAVERHPGELRVTPGKLVFELQPAVDWDKGRAVLHLLRALGPAGDRSAPVYLGDDVTDEHAFEALEGRGLRVFVGRADDPEVAGRTTEADCALASTGEVERFLGLLADWAAAAPASR